MGGGTNYCAHIFQAAPQDRDYSGLNEYSCHGGGKQLDLMPGFLD